MNGGVRSFGEVHWLFDGGLVGRRSGTGQKIHWHTTYGATAPSRTLARAPWSGSGASTNQLIARSASG